MVYEGNNKVMSDVKKSGSMVKGIKDYNHFESY